MLFQAAQWTGLQLACGVHALALAAGQANIDVRKAPPQGMQACSWRLQRSEGEKQAILPLGPLTSDYDPIGAADTNARLPSGGWSPCAAKFPKLQRKTTSPRRRSEQCDYGVRAADETETPAS